MVPPQKERRSHEQCFGDRRLQTRDPGAARFDRVLVESEREEARELEELLQLEYSASDAVLYALGEEE